MNSTRWEKYKENTTPEERSLRYKENADGEKKVVSNKECNSCKEIKPIKGFHKLPTSRDSHHPTCKICRNARNRKRKENLTPEQKQQRRLNKKESHKKAHKVYREKLRKLKKEEQIKENKVLYQKISGLLDQGCTKKAVRAKLGLSYRFLSRLIKYKGHCYKTVTVIDRIKPKLDEFFEEKGIKEKAWGWLKMSNSNYPMRVDLYYKKLNLAIEYHGPQHFKEIGYGNLEEVQLRDLEKVKLLKRHKIDLIIFVSEPEIDEFINNHDLKEKARNEKPQPLRVY